MSWVSVLDILGETMEQSYGFHGNIELVLRILISLSEMRQKTTEIDANIEPVICMY
jgi:hypothetical protein